MNNKMIGTNPTVLDDNGGQARCCECKKYWAVNLLMRLDSLKECPSCGGKLIIVKQVVIKK